MKIKEFLYKISRLNLRTKYSFQILIIIILVAGALISITLNQFKKGMATVSKSVEELSEKALGEQMERKAEVVIATLAQDLINPFYYLDLETIEGLFNTIMDQEDVLYIYLCDTDGKIVYSEPQEYDLSDTILTDPVSKRALASETFLIQKKENILDTSMPIYLHDEKLGSVRVGFSLAKIQGDILTVKETISSITEKNTRRTLRASLITSLVLILLGTIFALKTAEVLVQPILKLTALSRKIGRGILTVKVKIKSGDELEELADSFNQMTEDLHNHQEELDSLHNSAKALSGNLELSSLLDRTLNTIKEIFKISKSSIMLLEDGSLVVKRAFGWKGEEVPREKPFSISEGIAGYVAQKKESILANDVNNHPLFEKESKRIWRGCRDLLCVPIIHEDKIKGVINIQDRLDGKPFTKTNLEYAEIITSSVGLSLSNIGLIKEEIEKTRMEQELKTAEVVQRTLLPAEDPHIEGIELASFYDPATETGGDWFGYIEDTQMQRLVILIGDVSGHGVPSALVTAAVNSFVRTLEIMKTRFYKMGELSERLKSSKVRLPTKISSLIQEESEDPLKPANILKFLNKIILNIGKRQFEMTLFASVLDLNTRILTFANAGHNPPYFYRNKLSNEDMASKRMKNLGILKAEGVRLGDEEVVDFKEQSIQLKKDDVILWFTDGIAECENGQGEEFSEKRLVKTLESSVKLNATEIKNTIVSKAYSFLGDTPKKDDVALIVAKIN